MSSEIDRNSVCALGAAFGGDGLIARKSRVAGVIAAVGVVGISVVAGLALVDLAVAAIVLIRGHVESDTVRPGEENSIFGVHAGAEAVRIIILGIGEDRG